MYLKVIIIESFSTDAGFSAQLTHANEDVPPTLVTPARIWANRIIVIINLVAV